MTTPFRKAKGEQAALKMALYGPAGSGKTMTALLLAEGIAQNTGKRVAYVDTEHGTDFYAQAVPSRTVHPEPFDFDAFYSRSIVDVPAAIMGISESDYSVVVVDSITHIWEAAINSYQGKTTRIGTIPIQAWGKIKKPYKDMLTFLLNTTMHVLICGRQSNEFDTNDDGEMRKVGVKMKAEGETPYEPHILIRMESVKPARSAESGWVEAFIEKDRTGILSGRTFKNPTFNDLAKPILPLLGLSQAKIDSAETVAGNDSEKIEAAEQQAEAESKAFLDDFTARLQLCKTEKELKELDKPIQAAKPQMMTEHIKTLREAYLAAKAKAR